MKVLLISKEYPFGVSPRFGGGGSHVFYLALSLATIGVDVLVLAYKGAKKERSPLASFPNVQVLGLDFGGEKELVPVGKDLKEALHICRQYQPDVIHAHHLSGGFLALVLAGAHDRPAVLTMHKPPKLVDESMAASCPAYQRVPFHGLWHVLAVDQRVGAHIAYSKIYEKENREVGVPDSKIVSISHGVPVEFLRQKAGHLPKKKRFGIDSGDTVIVSPFRPEKPGAELFLEAAKLVYQSAGQKFRLRFIAPGKPKPAYSGLVDFKKFSLRQMWELFHRAQICVLPSYREGLSIALLEAMAIGTPVVAFEVPGIHEVVDDGVSGLLVQAGKAKELAEGIIRLLHDRSLAARLAQNARKLVAEKFSAHNMAEKHLALYERLVADRGNRGREESSESPHR